MIRKRFTYEFFQFVHGKYKQDKKCLAALFDSMTAAEKLDILSAQFDIVWHRIWLNNPSKMYDIRDMYLARGVANATRDTLARGVAPTHNNTRTWAHKKARFDQISTDRSMSLRDIILRSKSVDVLWEIPKGARNDMELELDCAVREFTEETGIAPDAYRVLTIQPVTFTIEESGVTYVQNYFIAEAVDEVAPRLDLRNFHQVSEVDAIKWVAIGELEFMDIPEKRRVLMRQFMKRIARQYKQLRMGKLSCIRE